MRRLCILLFGGYFGRVPCPAEAALYLPEDDPDSLRCYGWVKVRR